VKTDSSNLTDWKGSLQNQSEKQILIEYKQQHQQNSNLPGANPHKPSPLPALNNNNNNTDLNKRLFASSNNDEVVEDVQSILSQSSSSANMDLDDADSGSSLFKKKSGGGVNNNVISSGNKQERNVISKASPQPALRRDSERSKRSSRNDLDRPPARLNYYDSESNTFSDGFNRAGSINNIHGNNQMRQVVDNRRRTNGIF
jgi:hypothetical protein